MSASVFLAQLIGPVALAMGLAVLLDRRRFRALAEEFLTSPALMFLSGVLTLPMGLAIVLTHNVWTADWRVLITLLGWIAIAAGIIRIFWPSDAASSGRKLLAHPNTLLIGGAFYVVIGAVLTFFGYFA
jgi:hypothetical protein